MNRGLAIFGLLVLCATAFGTGAQSRRSEGSPDDKTVTAILESLGTKADRPAGEVFRNVQMMEEVTAGNLIRIMQNGFGKALNVRCSHCHVDEDFAADEVRAKRAAREMIAMVRRINQDLERMGNLDTEMATVNCSTCHRGELRPAGTSDSRSRRR